MLKDQRTRGVVSRITEFPDGSRIFQSEEFETPMDVARVHGVDAEIFLNINQMNYPNLRKDTLLEKGTILELPNATSVVQDDGPATSGIFLSGMSTPVHVFGSGDNVGKRTEGLLQAKDKNKSYIVICGGREMKLSEFCQLAGNKKNRPRECIMISLTDEPLLDYETRIASGMPYTASYHQVSNFGHQQQHSSVFKVQDVQHVTDPGVGSMEIAENGSLVCMACPGRFRGKLGIVKSRSCNGIYEVDVLKAITTQIGHGLSRLIVDQSISVRRCQLSVVPASERTRRFHRWCISIQSALISFSGISGISPSFATTINSLFDSISTIRTSAMKPEFSLKECHALLNLLVLISSPEAWTVLCECLRRMDKDIGIGSSVTHFICVKEMISTLATQDSMVKSITEINPRKELIQHPLTSSDNSVGSAEVETELDFLSCEEERLVARLNEIDNQLAREARRQRALIRKQDSALESISDTLNSLEEKLIQEETFKTWISKECRLLSNILGFLDSSKAGINILVVDKLMLIAEKELQYRSDRNESIGALSTILETLNEPGLKGNASVRTMEFIDALQKEFDLIIQKEKNSLTAAYRVRDVVEELMTESRGLTMPPEPFVHSTMLSANKMQQGQKSPGSASRMPCNKFGPPVFEHVSFDSVVLGFTTYSSVSSDEYEVTWERRSERSRGGSGVETARTKECRYTVRGLAPATQYIFRYRCHCDGAWSEWSKYSACKTKDDLDGTLRFVEAPISILIFSPKGSRLEKMITQDSCALRREIAKAWNDKVNERLEKLSDLVRDWTSSIEKTLADSGFEAQPPPPQPEKKRQWEAHAAKRMREPDTESPARAQSIDDAAENVPISVAPKHALRARTKADLRLGAPRIISSSCAVRVPSDLGAREGKKARILESPSLSPSPKDNMEIVAAESATNEAIAEKECEPLDCPSSPKAVRSESVEISVTEQESRQRQELSDKLAARLRSGFASSPAGAATDKQATCAEQNVCTRVMADSGGQETETAKASEPEKSISPHQNVHITDKSLATDGKNFGDAVVVQAGKAKSSGTVITQLFNEESKAVETLATSVPAYGQLSATSQVTPAPERNSGSNVSMLPALSVSNVSKLPTLSSCARSQEGEVAEELECTGRGGGTEGGGTEGDEGRIHGSRGGVVEVANGSRVVVKWETKWAEKTDGWVEAEKTDPVWSGLPMSNSQLICGTITPAALNECIILEPASSNSFVYGGSLWTCPTGQRPTPMDRAASEKRSYTISCK